MRIAPHGPATLCLLAGLAALQPSCTDGADLASIPGAGAATGTPGASAGPTWHHDVAPLVSFRCSGCHREGGIGPFSLTSYETARPFAAAMAAATASGRMPPWHAIETSECQPRYKWRGDQRLTAEEKALLQRWADGGAPAGDPAGAPALRPPTSTALANPSKRVFLPAPYALPAGGRDVFRCFSLPHVFEQDSWLNGLQVVPGNSKVVHHVLVWLDQDGEGMRKAGAEGSYPCFGAPGFQSSLLGAWAPGAQGLDAPPTVGLRVPKGSRIIMNVHYHPGPAAETDNSAIDLRWATEPPLLELKLSLPGNARTAAAGLMAGPADPPEGPDFSIPAGAKGHEERMLITIGDTLPTPAWIVTVGTHMHYVGTGMKVEVDRSQRAGGPPSGEPARECLIETPRYDFHWQRGYAYEAPVTMLPTLMKGDQLHLRCRYDNTLDNPYVAAALREQGLAAPREVRIGEQTLDEMCLGIVGVVAPRTTP
jgi:hypothetical protein